MPLEANFCYYLEFDDEVDRYESQPLGRYFTLSFNAAKANLRSLFFKFVSN